MPRRGVVDRRDFGWDLPANEDPMTAIFNRDRQQSMLNCMNVERFPPLARNKTRKHEAPDEAANLEELAKRGLPYVARKTKLDKIEDENKINPLFRHKLLSSDVRIHKLIYGEIKDLNFKDPIQKLIGTTARLTNYRHDNWVEYFNMLLENKHEIGDKNVARFLGEMGTMSENMLTRVVSCIRGCLSTLEQEDLESTLKGAGLPPLAILKLSPDFLFMQHGVVYLGDISLISTASEDMRDAKRRKYDKVFDALIQLKFCVRKMNFMPDPHTLSGIDDFFTEFRDLFKPVDKVMFELFVSYHFLINDANKQIQKTHKTFNIQHNDVVSRMIREKVEVDIEDISWVPKPEPYVPKYTEDQIIEMIEKELSKEKERPNLFNTDPANINKSFQKVIESTTTPDGVEKPVVPPKSTLKVVSNCHDYSETTNHELIREYIIDMCACNDENSQMAASLFPSIQQLDKMKQLYDTRAKVKDIKKDALADTLSVKGPFSYKDVSRYHNKLYNDLRNHLSKKKNKKNKKKQVTRLETSKYPEFLKFVDDAIDYYGEKSNKPAFLDSSWDSANNGEKSSSSVEREVYDQVRQTNGAQLCQAMSSLYQKIVHTSVSQSQKCTLIFTPPNSSFVCIIPENHSPFNKSNCDIPMIFFTRSREPMKHNEYFSSFQSNGWYYYISELSRLNINKISNWDNAGYKLCASASYLASKCRGLTCSVKKVVGLLTYMMLDCHQKTSEYTELLKYLSYMPFGDAHNLPLLIEDKCSMITKTRLDIWMLERLRRFCDLLSKRDELKAGKPRLVLTKSLMSAKSAGVTVSLPSFIDLSVRHVQPIDFIEETAAVHIIRPKKLYGSQFMDKGISAIGEWNDEYESELLEHGGWAKDGRGDGAYPFGSKFCFSADLIHYANLEATREMDKEDCSIKAKIVSSVSDMYMHEACSLRGCTKEKKDRFNSIDLHSTSIDECLRYYREHGYDQKSSRLINIVLETLGNRDLEYIFQFSMSEKEQRAGGRMIATPTLRTKACLKFLELPEQIRGRLFGNNIIIPGVNKLQRQAEVYKSTVSMGAVSGYSHVYQITEDQSKFSENDNIAKFYPYLQTDTIVPPNVRGVQIKVLDLLRKREHLVKRMPDRVPVEFPHYLNEDMNGIKANIGWPQGMLNCLSTSIHCDVDIWISAAFNRNRAVDKRVVANGLVHSDDSWVVVCCNGLEEARDFALFRIIAKKMACLKTNWKKFWMSSILGEMVSNFNFNGNVHMPVSKSLINGFGNLTYQNWTIDVSNQISTIQQCYRNGATVPTLILLKTILRQQLIQTYNVKGKQLELMDGLPIELGGFPTSSAFELAVTGTTCYYNKLIKYYRAGRFKVQARIVTRCIELSRKCILEAEENATRFKKPDIVETALGDRQINEEDFENMCLPQRGDIFNCLRHLFPKSRKIARTIAHIKSLPFETDGLEMIVAHPKKIETALGHLKSRTSSMIYELAAEHYTSSVRRLAASQVMQSSGKVIRLCSGAPLTLDELLTVLESNSEEIEIDLASIETAFDDGSTIQEICYRVVNHSERYTVEKEHRKVLNKMPYIDDRFTTVCRMEDVLLHIIDIKRENTRHLSEHGSENINWLGLALDRENILNRFGVYFEYYTPEAACSLVMRQYQAHLKSRLWVQPQLNNTTLYEFCSSLYGKTLSETDAYIINIRWVGHGTNYMEQVVNTLYNTLVINSIYPDMFQIDNVEFEYDHEGEKMRKVMDITEVLSRIDDIGMTQNDRLKLGVFEHVMTGNDTRLRTYIKNLEYKQYYPEPQEWSGGEYRGPFKCKVQMGKFIMLIVHNPLDGTKIRANSSDIYMAMKAMHEFTRRNFEKRFGYTNYNEWGKSDLWKTVRSDFTLNPLEKEVGLVYYSPVLTRICEPPIGHTSFLSFQVVAGLSDIGGSEDVKYQLAYSDHYRVIGRYIPTVNWRDGSIMEYSPGCKVMRICSIYQDFELPVRKNINIRPTLLDGVLSSSLYHTGMIQHLITQNYDKITNDMVIQVMDETPGLVDSSYFVNFFVDLYGSLKELGRVHIEDRAVEVFETIEMRQDYTEAEFIEVDAATAPENLDFAIQDFDDVFVQKRICRHNNLRVTLLSIFGDKLTDGEINVYRSLIVNDQDFVKWVDEIDKLWENEKMTELSDLSDYIMCNREWRSDDAPDMYIISTMVASGFFEGGDMFSMDNLWRSSSMDCNDSRVLAFHNRVKKGIALSVFEETPTKRTLLTMYNQDEEGSDIDFSDFYIGDLEETPDCNVGVPVTIERDVIEILAPSITPEVPQAMVEDEGYKYLPEEYPQLTVGVPDEEAMTVPYSHVLRTGVTLAMSDFPGLWSDEPPDID